MAGGPSRLSAAIAYLNTWESSTPPPPRLISSDFYYSVVIQIYPSSFFELELIFAEVLIFLLHCYFVFFGCFLWLHIDDRQNCIY